MRNIMLVILLGGFAVSAQSIVENAAAAAGGSVGGVAGKKLSDGLSKIFGKVDAATGKAAGDQKRGTKSEDAAEPLIEVGPGAPRSDGSAVPPPPPSHHAAVRHFARPAPAARAEVEPPAPAPAPPPPPLKVTTADLQKIALGMSREDVLKIGQPSSRIMMSDEGHLAEIFHYASKDSTLGVIRLTDGVVSSIRIP